MSHARRNAHSRRRCHLRRADATSATLLPPPLLPSPPPPPPPPLPTPHPHRRLASTVPAVLAALAKFGWRVLQRGALAAFHTWLDLMDTRRRALKIAGRVGRRSLLCAWNSWTALGEERRRLRRFGARLKFRQASRAMGGWADAVSEQREVARRRDKLRQKVLRRMRGDRTQAVSARTPPNPRPPPRSPSTPPSTPHARHSTALQASPTSVMRQVFDAWSELASAEAERKRALRQRAANRMRNQLLVLTFEAWASLLGEAVRRQQVIRPFVNLLKNRTLTIVFRAWKDGTAEAKALRKRYAAKIVHTLLAKTFGAWAALTAETRALERERRRIATEALRKLQFGAVLQCFRAWNGYLVAAREALTMAAARWQIAGAAAAFETWKEMVFESMRLVALGRRMILRTQNSLLARCWLAWVALLRRRKEERECSKMRVLASLTGKAELLVKVLFYAWRDEARATAQRRIELTIKFMARYKNAALAKTFLAWVALTAHEASLRRAKMTPAAAFISGQRELMLRLCFDAFVRAVRAAAEEREGESAQARQEALRLTAESSSKFAASAQALLQTTQSLSEAVAELRQSGAKRERFVEETVDATAARLDTIEKQLRRTEKLLAPLPAQAVDQAAYALMREEVGRLSSALAATQRQMAAMQSAKAGRHELALMANGWHAMLFGSGGAARVLRHMQTTPATTPAPVAFAPPEPAYALPTYQPAHLPATVPLDASAFAAAETRDKPRHAPFVLAVDGAGAVAAMSSAAAAAEARATEASSLRPHPPESPRPHPPESPRPQSASRPGTAGRPTAAVAAARAAQPIEYGMVRESQPEYSIVRQASRPESARPLSRTSVRVANEPFVEVTDLAQLFSTQVPGRSAGSGRPSTTVNRPASAASAQQRAGRLPGV